MVVWVLGATCGRSGDSCGPAELSRRDADEALEVMGELTLVGEAGARGDFRQRDVVAVSQESLRPLDASLDDILVRRQPGGHFELPGEVVLTEMGRRRHLLQGQAGVEVFLDVLDDGAELPPRQRAVRPTRRRARTGSVPDQ